MRLPCLLMLLLLCLPAFADETKAPKPEVVRPPLEQRSQLNAGYLQRQLPRDEQQPLEAGSERFLALWRPADGDKPKGTVLIVPGTGESADWPIAVAPLRNRLPQTGWHTLSLTLPDPADSLPAAEATAPTPEKPQDGESGDAQPAETATADALPPGTDAAPPSADQAYVQNIEDRLQAAVDFALQQKPPALVLLGHGSGAYWAARFLADRKPASVKGLAIIAARLPEGFEPALDNLVPPLGLATGDFFYSSGRADTEAADKRLQASRRLPHPGYRSVALTPLPDRAADQEQLYRRIRGWLDASITP